MKLVPFGRSGLEVSNLCLGASNFGWNTDERTSHAILNTFCANGGNFVQAGSAVNAMGTALSELHVGSWIHQRDIMRNELVLATKLVVRPEAALDRDTLRRYVRACCAESLRRLRVEHLDLLLCEFRSAVLPIAALLEAAAYLVDEGLVRFIGVSEISAASLREANHAAAAGTLPRVDVVQDDYSLVKREPFETELAAACREVGTVFLARSPLAGGFLSGSTDRSQGWTSLGDRMRLSDGPARSARIGRRDQIARIAERRGSSLEQTALAWVLANPAVTSAVVAVTSPAELVPLVAGAAETLSAQDVAQLAAVAAPRARDDSEHELAEADA